jgi:3-oxoacyl-[acyl-carrier protein] reductase
MKIAILTGANGNLGKGFLETLTASGYFIYGIDLNISKLKKTKRLKPLELNITDEKSVKKFYKDNISQIDVLINNAGMGVFAPFEKVTAKEFRMVTDVNLLGTFLMSKYAICIMKKQKKGKIINIGSIYGQVSSDPRVYGSSGRNNSQVYSATKAGVIMLTKYMAAHFARYNIQSNCISPGGIFNNQASGFVRNYESKTPSGRMANVQDIQSALRFLISDDSGYVNGQNITVDGGFTIW